MSHVGYLKAQAARSAEVQRDRWDRPLIIPLDGGEPVPYTRISTAAKALEDLNIIMSWKVRKTLEGVLRRPDLLTRTAGALANGNPDTDWPVKKDLNRIGNEAQEAAGASTGRSAGTGFHALTEAIDRGEEPAFVPDADRVRLDAYSAAVCDLTPLSAETFVVIDELRVAGSFDRLWRNDDPVLLEKAKTTLPPGVRVGDLKTGKSEDQYPLSSAMQIAMYAHGQRYNPETGERTPLHPDIDLETGLLIHMPPTGGCTVLPLDLIKGWQAAQMAAEVHHTVRRWKSSDLIRSAS